jgi:hypothetical protein
MAALMLGVRTRIERITGRAEQVSVYLPAIPGLVVNDRLVSAGRVPHEFEVMGWMAEALENA